jgi:hypothetical protein
MVAKFERSPEIQEKIDTICAMPQGIILKDTPENRQKVEDSAESDKLYGIRDAESGNEIQELNNEKRLEAKLLRQEIMWGTAHLIKRSFEIIIDTPDITSDALFEKCMEDEMVINPKTLSKFNELLVENVEKTRNFYENILHYSAKKGITAEEFLFQTLIIDDKLKGRKRSSIFPKNPSKISFHPLAVQIQLSEEDFALIDPQQNVGGFYKSEYKLISHNPKIEFGGALIAVKNTTNEEDLLIVYKHEEGHAFQNIIDNSMENVTDEEVEVKTNHFYEVLGKTYSKLLNTNSIEELNELYKSDIEVQRGIAEMLYVCESMAADEILADKNANRPMSHYINVLVTSDLYDYVNDVLTTYLNRQNPDSSEPEEANPAIRSFLTEIYHKDLIETTKSARDLDAYYNRLSPHRAPLFREALRVIPIDQWDSFLKESMCVAEAETWQKIQNDLWEVLFHNSVFNRITDFKYPLSDEAIKLRNEYNRVNVVARETVSTANIYPIYKQLKEIAEQAGELALSLVDLPEYNTMIMCQFVDRIKEYVKPDHIEEYKALQEQFSREVVANPGDQEVLNKYKTIFNDTFVFNQDK